MLDEVLLMSLRNYTPTDSLTHWQGPLRIKDVVWSITTSKTHIELRTLKLAAAGPHSQGGSPVHPSYLQPSAPVPYTGLSTDPVWAYCCNRSLKQLLYLKIDVRMTYKFTGATCIGMRWAWEGKTDLPEWDRLRDRENKDAEQ